MKPRHPRWSSQEGHTCNLLSFPGKRRKPPTFRNPRTFLPHPGDTPGPPEGGAPPPFTPCQGVCGHPLDPAGSMVVGSLTRLFFALAPFGGIPRHAREKSRSWLSRPLPALLAFPSPKTGLHCAPAAFSPLPSHPPNINSSKRSKTSAGALLVFKQSLLMLVCAGVATRA